METSNQPSTKPIRETTHPPLILNTKKRIPLLKTATHHPDPEPTLPVTQSKFHPAQAQLPSRDKKKNECSIFFIGTATTVISHPRFRILTDPNFLHGGDHVHLGPAVTATRLTNPAVPALGLLPPVDAILLSHYHEDHFDREVEAQLSRDVPIITTPHAAACLADATERRGEGMGGFRRVRGVGVWEGVVLLDEEGDVDLQGGGGGVGAAQEVGGGDGDGDGDGKKKEAVRVTAMPGKHVPPGPLAKVNELLGAVPPVNGWLVELGWARPGTGEDFETGHRIYISGDTLMVDELKEIPKRLQGDKIDLMLVHLGGTTIPGPKMPLLMVTMDAQQGVQLMRLVEPDVTVPIHFDDYDVFCSPLDDFKKEVAAAGFTDRVVYLDRGEEYRFAMRDGGS